MADAALQTRKDALRVALRGRRAGLAPNWVAEASAKLAGRLLELPEIRVARVVMGYLALPGEANLDAVLRALQAANMRVCVPARVGPTRATVLRATGLSGGRPRPEVGGRGLNGTVPPPLLPQLADPPREYDPAWLPPEADLVCGALGVREPAEPEWVGDEIIDVVLVPGVAFDAQGGRLGRGKGYYDRMLARLGPRVKWRVGVAFEFQMAVDVPCGPRDERVDAVVSEAGVYRPANAARTDRKGR